MTLRQGGTISYDFEFFGASPALGVVLERQLSSSQIDISSCQSCLLSAENSQSIPKQGDTSEKDLCRQLFFQYD